MLGEFPIIHFSADCCLYFNLLSLKRLKCLHRARFSRALLFGRVFLHIRTGCSLLEAVMKTWLMSHAPHRVLLSPDMTQLTFYIARNKDCTYGRWRPWIEMCLRSAQLKGQFTQKINYSFTHPHHFPNQTLFPL